MFGKKFQCKLREASRRTLKIKSNEVVLCKCVENIKVRVCKRSNGYPMHTEKQNNLKRNEAP